MVTLRPSKATSRVRVPFPAPICRCGGIGIHNGFKIRREKSLRVQVPPSAPFNKYLTAKGLQLGFNDTKYPECIIMAGNMAV